VETLIEHLWITVDGEEVQRINHYNQVFRMLWDSEQRWDEQRARHLLSFSSYIINGLNQNIYTFTNTPMCMTKWYGLLGSGAVIDTRLTGPIVVNMQFAPNSVLLSSLATAIYSLSDVNLNVRVLPDTTPVPRTCVFDNFRCILQSNTNFTQITQMAVTCRKLKYMAATFLTPGYRSTAITTTSNPIGTSAYFTRGTSAAALPVFNFNFAVDEANLMDPTVNYLYGLVFMQMIFPDGMTFYNVFTNNGAISNQSISTAGFLKGCFACGIPVVEPGTDDPTSRVLKFTTSTTDVSSTSNIANLSLFAACHESSLVYDPTANKYRVLL